MEATIYLADQRGCTQTDWFRSYHSFNFGSYFDENKKPFGDISAFNEDTLKAGSVLSFQVKELTAICIIPIVGAVEYTSTTGVHGLVKAGQAHTFFLEENSFFKILNPYEGELINFLHIWMTVEPSANPMETVKSEFDLDLNRNQLLPISFDVDQSKIYLGKFDGRREGSLKLMSEIIFIFVLEGTFEVQNRLLQLRDGLAIKGAEEVQFEALSKDAIILMMEAGEKLIKA